MLAAMLQMRAPPKESQVTRQQVQWFELLSSIVYSLLAVALWVLAAMLQMRAPPKDQRI